MNEDELAGRGLTAVIGGVWAWCAMVAASVVLPDGPVGIQEGVTAFGIGLVAVPVGLAIAYGLGIVAVRLIRMVMQDA